jgi:hypothetical protein
VAVLPSVHTYWHDNLPCARMFESSTAYDSNRVDQSGTPPARRLTPLLWITPPSGLALQRGGELLDLLLGVGRVRIIGCELDELLVRLDRGLVVARVLRRLREEQLVGRLGRIVERGDLLVDGGEAGAAGQRAAASLRARRRTGESFSGLSAYPAEGATSCRAAHADHGVE